MSWAKQLEKLADKGGHDLGELCKNVKMQLFTSVSQLTRVGEPSTWKSKAPAGYVGGRLRGNWQISEFSAPKGELSRIDPTGSAVDSDIKKASEDGVTYFVNNLPYAKTYENEDAMVGRSVRQVKSAVKAEIRRLR